MLHEERHGRTILLRMDRPPANALSNELIDALRDTFARLRAAPGDVDAVVLTGAGSRFFSAGGDIKELETLAPADGRARLIAFDKALDELAALPRPVVCAVNGHAVGGAFELCLFADHVVSVAGARFGFPEINHGILPVARGIDRATRMLGPKNARRLLYTGDLVDAGEARALGIVDEIVGDDALVDRAIALASALGAKGATLFASIKATINAAGTRTDAELLATTLASFDDYFQTDEMRAGLATFHGRD
jgi:enoyl-CoA hydratase/carnithine racemase